MAYSPREFGVRTPEFAPEKLRAGSARKQVQVSAQSQSTALSGQSSTLLPDGRLLLLGGEGKDGPVTTASIKVASTGETTQLPAGLLHARAYHSATVLPDGTVLIWGGVGTDGKVLDVAESFSPATATFSALPATGLLPRAHHTATLLTDGLLFITGGVSKHDQTVGNAELWDFRSNTSTDLANGLLTPRYDHTAAIQADGTVLLWGGINGVGQPIPDGEVFDPATQTFRLIAALPAAAVAGQMPQVEATVPEDDAQNVPVNALVSLRFSTALQVQTVSSSTVTLAGPDGALPAKVIPAEGGMLAFLTPAVSLASGTSYSANITGLTDQSGNPLPDATLSFTTAGQPDSGEAGILGGTDSGTWPGGPQNSPWKKLPPLQAPPGVTAISGQVLLLDGHPLTDVTLRVGSSKSKTDGTGRFLLRDITSGPLVMIIDGRTASGKGATYGVFPDQVVVTGGQTNILSYTIWMPVIDTAHAVTIPVPTNSETVVTTPLIAGLELHIPSGTTITDIDGHITNQVSITQIPVNQPPFPLPPGVNVPVYFTIQPGGGWIWVNNSGGPDGGWLVYPNSFHLPAGSPFDFWNYKPEDNGWYVYGHGKVTADRTSIVPDPGVVIYELTGAMVGGPGLGAAIGRWVACHVWHPAWCSGGEPVDLGTGLFVYDKTDFLVSDVIPIELTRTYRQNDAASRAFGVGTSHNYDIFLVGDTSAYAYQELILADGSRVDYQRTSPGTSWTNAVYQANSSPGPFFGSTIFWNGVGWTLTRRDGMIYAFPESSGASRGQQGALLSITDRHGNKLTITRDSNSNITQITSPNGRWIQFTYDSNYRITQIQDNIGRTVQYFYDSGGRLNRVVDVNGGTWQYNYDSNNNMTSLIDPRNITYLQNQYDSLNRVSKQTLADNVSTYQFAYNPGCVSNCSVITETDVTDPNGNVKKVNFNPAPIFSNGFSTGGTGSTVTFAAGTSVAQTFSYQYQAGTNLLTSIVDPLSRTTSYTYDPLGNSTSVTRLAGTSNPVTTSFGYESKFSQTTSATDPLGHATSFAYDSNGNLITATDPMGNTSTFAYNPAGQVVSVADPLGETTNLAYDGGDLTSVTDPLGRTTNFFTDSAGRRLSAINPLGQITKFNYNPQNEITQVTDAASSVTSYAYDPNGNLTSVTDPRNTSNPTTYTYDNSDRLATRQDSLGNQESYQYDGIGNPTQFTDRRGKVSKFTYDALNRRTFAGFGQSGGSYESTINYTFDAGNRLTQAVDSITGMVTRGYDGLNRLTSETTPQGAVSYTYDLAGRRNTMTVAGQPTVSYGFDNANRLDQITQGTSTVQFAYDAAGRRTSITLPNGVVENYTYDAGSQLAAINYALGQNPLGNLAYGYDLAGRRVQESGSLAHTGLPQPISTTAYNVANQLTQWGTATPIYDANGNTLSDGTNSYTWDARNHLVSMNSGSMSFQYDPFGRRVAKTTILGTTNYLYDGLNPVQELAGTTPTANLLTGGIDEYFQRTDSNGPANFLTDAIGSMLALIDPSGNTLAQYTYEPFGNTTITGSSTNPYQYTGRENDGTGLYFYRGRYYSPTLQRFVSEDPIGKAGGINVYLYALNNPISFRDPFGFDSRGFAFGGAGAGGCWAIDGCPRSATASSSGASSSSSSSQGADGGVAEAGAAATGTGAYAASQIPGAVDAFTGVANSFFSANPGLYVSTVDFMYGGMAGLDLTLVEVPTTFAGELGGAIGIILAATF
jgi:RHS repeat-associated protein